MHKIYKIITKISTGECLSNREFTKKKTKSNSLLSYKKSKIISILVASIFVQQVAYGNPTYSGDKDDLVSNPLGLGDKGVAPKDAGSYSPSNNAITIEFNPSSSGDNIPNFVFGGFAYKNVSSGNVDIISENNSIVFNQGSVNGDVYGGYTYAIANDGTTAVTITKGNSVILNGIKVGGNIYGGYAQAKGGVSTAAVEAIVIDNHIVINSGTEVAGSIYGGYAKVYSNNSSNTSILIPATVTHNSVSIIGNAQINGDVYGGYADILANASVGTVSHNRVTIDGGVKVEGSVSGGYSFIRNNISTATDNKVIINSAVVGKNIYGGYAYASSESATATNNSVILTGDTIIGASVYGGYTTAGRTSVADNNHITVSDSVQIKENIYGGQSYANGYSSAMNNTVTLNNSTQVNKNIYGGQALVMLGYDANMGVDIKTNNNTINLNHNVNVSGSIYGGAADLQFFSQISPKISLYAVNNTLNISDNVTFSLSSNIYGGFLSSGFGNIYDNLKGHEYSFDVFTGNTLNFTAHPIVINKLTNFEYYNFTIDPALANSSTALIHANEIILGSDGTNVSTGETNTSKVQVIGIRAGRELQGGDRFILMNADKLIGTGIGISTQGVAQQGISLLYDVVTTVDMDNNEVIVTIPGNINPHGKRDGGKDGEPFVRVNPKLKSLSQGRLAALALTMQGADLISERNEPCKTDQGEQGRFCSFVNMSGSSSRYNTGSHIDLDAFNMLAGINYLPEDLNNLTIGIFAESGWGDYDSYNSFYNTSSVHGKGDTYYYGAGIYGQYTLDNGVYMQGSLRTGKAKIDFDSKDLMSVEGLWANYNHQSSYNSAHIGLGYVFGLNEKNSFDLSTKYLWSRIDGKSQIIAGDPIHFNALNSQRIRAMGQWNYQYSKRTTFNTALGYEYEMDGKATGTTYYTHQIGELGIKGGTGIISLGANFKPKQNTNGTGLSIDVKTKGYIGKREGVGAQLDLNYLF